MPTPLPSRRPRPCLPVVLVLALPLALLSPVSLNLAFAFPSPSPSPLPSHRPRPRHHPCQRDTDAHIIVISPLAFIHACARTHTAGFLGMSLLLTNSTFTDIFRHRTGPRLMPSALAHAWTHLTLWTSPLDLAPCPCPWSIAARPLIPRHTPPGPSPLAPCLTHMSQACWTCGRREGVVCRLMALHQRGQGHCAWATRVRVCTRVLRPRRACAMCLPLSPLCRALTLVEHV
jgi:hypothetical protein